MNICQDLRTCKLGCFQTHMSKKFKEAITKLFISSADAPGKEWTWPSAWFQTALTSGESVFTHGLYKYTNHQGQSKSKIHTLNSHSRLHSLCHNQPGFLKIFSCHNPQVGPDFEGSGNCKAQGFIKAFDLFMTRDGKGNCMPQRFLGFKDPKDKSQQIWPIKCDRDNSKIECMTQFS